MLSWEATAAPRKIKHKIKHDFTGQCAPHNVIYQCPQVASDLQNFDLFLPISEKLKPVLKECSSGRG